MSSLMNLDKFTKDIARRISPYMEKMLSIHGSGIISLFIYGSACTRDYIKGIHTVNSAIILKDLNLSSLKKSLKLIDHGIRQEIAAPLFLTRNHLETSSDTFPIELIEMKENHILLFGEDLLKDIKIEQEHMRFICEQQLKGKLITIRQAYLEIGLRKKGLELLVKESFDSLFPVFKGLLRIKGVIPPKTKEEALKALSGTFGIDTGIFTEILTDDKNDEKIGNVDIELFFDEYINRVARLAEISDNL